MELIKLKNLPLEEQVKELKYLKENFSSEKKALKEQIQQLEDFKKKKIKNIQDIGSKHGLITSVDIKDLTSEIRNTRDLLDSKNKELALLEKAISNAENILKQSSDELETQEQKAIQNELISLLQRLHIEEQEKKFNKVQTQVQSLENETLGNQKEESELEEELRNTLIDRKLKDEAPVYGQPDAPSYESQQDYSKDKQQKDIYTPQPEKERKYETKFEKNKKEKEKTIKDELEDIKKYD